MMNTFEDNKHDRSPTREANDRISHEQTEKIRKQHEQAHELVPEADEKNSERARVEAMENAVSVEKTTDQKEHTPGATKTRRGAISKRDLETNYKQTMEHVQRELSPQSRAFSKVIHNKAVEQTSELLGATIARPNAILAGAIGAFIITLAVYLIAKNFGYRLSGSESIAGFILGWVIGLLFDYFRVMITGKRP